MTGIRSDRTAVRWLLIALAVAGLAVDAYVHFDLASNYDPVSTSTVSQGDLFRAAAAVAVVAAAVLVIRDRWYTAAFTALVAGSALVALLVYRYNDLGAIGPIPNMYEPVWFTEKTVSGIAEAVALVASAELLLPSRRRASARA